MSIPSGDDAQPKPSEEPPKGNQHDLDPFFQPRDLIGFTLTITLIIVGVAQWFVYDRQAKIMDTQTRISEAQLDITRSTQRASIAVSELRIETDDNAAGHYKFTPIIRNNGQTPALDVSIVFADPHSERNFLKNRIIYDAYAFASWKVGAPFDPDEILQSDPGAFASVKHITINGGGSSLTASGLASSIADNDGINSQTGKLGRFIFGSVHYKDIFKIDHVSKYCFRIDGAIMNGAQISNLQSACNHWNCADEFCDEDKNAYNTQFEAALKEYASRNDMRSHPTEPFPAATTATPTKP